MSPVFNNIFTANIYWECGRRGEALPLMQGCSCLLSQYHNGLFQEKKQTGGGGVEDILF